MPFDLEFEDSREGKPRLELKVGDNVIGPCGYGVEIVEVGDKYVTIEHYNGNRERLRRDKIVTVIGK